MFTKFFFFLEKPYNVIFDGEIVKNNFPLQKMLDFFLVQDRVLDRVQDKVGLRKFSSNFFFAKSLKMLCLMEKL